MNLNTILGFLLFFYFLSIVYYEYIKCYRTDNLMSGYKLNNSNKNAVKNICGEYTTKNFFRKTLRKILTNQQD